MTEATVLLDAGTLAVLMKIARDLGGVSSQVETNTDSIEWLREKYNQLAT